VSTFWKSIGGREAALPLLPPHLTLMGFIFLLNEGTVDLPHQPARDS
jgi:hypothetical protein